MRPISWICVLALAASALPPAQAQNEARPGGGPMLGGTVEDMCRSTERQPSLLCATYLRGSFEGLMMGQASMADGDTTFCLPDQGITLSQVREGFLVLMLAEPDRRALYASISLLDTLQDSFPCTTEEDEDLVPMIDTASAHRRPNRTGPLLGRAAHRSDKPFANMLR